MSTILITGARGTIGGRVVTRLVAAGARVRVLLRSPHPAFDGLPIDTVHGSYDDAAAVAAAMRGVSRALLITAGPGIPHHDGALADAAKQAGVEHLVKISVFGARPDGSEIPRWHAGGEHRIAATGIGATLLRPSSFASNARGWIASLRATGKAFGALGAAALPVIHPDDIADAAVAALTQPGHAGKTYALTGPEALTAAEQVAILAEVTGRPFAYVNVADDAARKAMADAGMPAPVADAMIHLIQDLRAAERIAPTDTIPTILGRPARTFRQWATEHAPLFQDTTP